MKAGWHVILLHPSLNHILIYGVHVRRNDSIKTSGVTIHKSPQVSINDFYSRSSLFSFLVVKFKSLSPFASLFV